MSRVLLHLALACLAVAAALPTYSVSASVVPPRLSSELRRELDAGGPVAAEMGYRELRQREFAGYRESPGDTDDLAHELLESGRIDDAILMFRLNLETHPDATASLNGLGAALLMRGDRDNALAAYERALEIDPRNRTARFEAARLRSGGLPSFAPIVWVHIVMGMIGILTGAAALAVTKGSPVHRGAGVVFVVAMLLMAGSAAIRSSQVEHLDDLNFWMAALTIYLVVSGWSAAHDRRFVVRPWQWLQPFAAIGIATGLFALSARTSAEGPAMVFGVVAALSGIADVRWLWPRPERARNRLLRHLWRIGLALFIAVGSFFLGQQQVFPYSIRKSGVLFLPVLMVVASLGYFAARHRAVKTQPVPVE